MGKKFEGETRDKDGGTKDRRDWTDSSNCRRMYGESIKRRSDQVD